MIDRGLPVTRPLDQSLVECLNQPPSLSKEPQGSLDDIRIEAAHVISSISYGMWGKITQLA